MAAELIRYAKGKPAIQDGLIADNEPFVCQSESYGKKCGVEYRLHYSRSEERQLSKLRSKCQHAVNQSHSAIEEHPNSIPVSVADT